MCLVGNACLKEELTLLPVKLDPEAADCVLPRLFQGHGLVWQERCKDHSVLQVALMVTRSLGWVSKGGGARDNVVLIEI